MKSSLILSLVLHKVLLGYSAGPFLFSVYEQPTPRCSLARRIAYTQRTVLFLHKNTVVVEVTLTDWPDREHPGLLKSVRQ